MLHHGSPELQKTSLALLVAFKMQSRRVLLGSIHKPHLHDKYQQPTPLSATALLCFTLNQLPGTLTEPAKQKLNRSGNSGVKQLRRRSARSRLRILLLLHRLSLFSIVCSVVDDVGPVSRWPGQLRRFICLQLRGVAVFWPKG